MQTSRIQQRGRVMVPKDIMNEAEMSTGDFVTFRVVGKHQVILEVIPVKPLQYFWEKFATDQPYDDDAIREEWHQVAAAEAMGE